MAAHPAAARPITLGARCIVSISSRHVAGRAFGHVATILPIAWATAQSAISRQIRSSAAQSRIIMSAIEDVARGEVSDRSRAT